MVKKILGTRNPADVLTKPKACHEVAELLRGAGIRIEGRRPQPLRHASSITIPDVRNGMPEKMPVEKPTTTMPPQGRTEAFGLGAETRGGRWKVADGRLLEVFEESNDVSGKRGLARSAL